MYLSAAILVCLCLGSQAFHPGFGPPYFGARFPPMHRGRFGPFGRGFGAMNSARTRQAPSAFNVRQPQTNPVQTARQSVQPVQGARQSAQPVQGARQSVQLVQGARQSVQPVQTAPNTVPVQAQTQLRPVQSTPGFQNIQQEPQYVVVETASQPMSAQQTSQPISVQSISQQLPVQSLGQPSTQYIVLNQPDYGVGNIENAPVMVLPGDYSVQGISADPSVVSNTNGGQQETYYVISQDHPAPVLDRNQYSVNSNAPTSINQAPAPIQAIAINQAPTDITAVPSNADSPIYQTPAVVSGTGNKQSSVPVTDTVIQTTADLASNQSTVIAAPQSPQPAVPQNRVAQVSGTADPLERYMREHLIAELELPPHVAATLYGDVQNRNPLYNQHIYEAMDMPKLPPSMASTSTTKTDANAAPVESYSGMETASATDYQVHSNGNSQVGSTGPTAQSEYSSTTGGQSAASVSQYDNMLAMGMAEALEYPVHLNEKIQSGPNAKPKSSSSTSGQYDAQGSQYDRMLAMQMAEAMDYPIHLNGNLAESSVGPNAERKSSSTTRRQSATPDSQYDRMLAMRMAEALDYPPHMI